MPEMAAERREPEMALTWADLLNHGLPEKYPPEMWVAREVMWCAQGEPIYDLPCRQRILLSGNELLFFCHGATLRYRIAGYDPVRCMYRVVSSD